MIMKTLYATSFYLLLTGLTFVSSATINNIQNSAFVGKCMFAPSTAPNTRVTLNECIFDNSNPNQIWEISASDADLGQIRLAGSDACLDSSLTVQSCDDGNSDSELFLFTSDGFSILEKNQGLCVAAKNDGINLEITECSDQKGIWIAS